MTDRIEKNEGEKIKITVQGPPVPQEILDELFGIGTKGRRQVVAEVISTKSPDDNACPHFFSIPKKEKK